MGFSHIKKAGSGEGSFNHGWTQMNTDADGIGFYAELAEKREEQVSQKDCLQRTMKTREEVGTANSDNSRAGGPNCGLWGPAECHVAKPTSWLPVRCNG